jgi:hypothetical protein
MPARRKQLRCSIRSTRVPKTFIRRNRIPDDYDVLRIRRDVLQIRDVLRNRVHRIHDDRDDDDDDDDGHQTNH